MFIDITEKFGRDIDESYACSSKNRKGVGWVLMAKRRCMFPTVVIMELTKTYMLMQERLEP